MIIHLIFDDKFIDYAIKQFMPYGNSRFLLVTNTHNPSFQYIKHKDKITILVYQSEEYFSFLGTLVDYNAIIIHGFYTLWQAEIVEKTPNNVKIAWVFWGGDLYQRPDVCTSFLAPLNLCLQKIHTIIKKETPTDCVPYSAFAKVHYLLSDEHEEYIYAMQYTDTNYHFCWYNYYSIEETICAELLNASVSGSNILVGHTAGIRTNHIDGFFKLKWMPLRHNKIIVPLSYGSPWYRNVVLKIGHWMFGKRFYPLTEFMPRSEYNRILKSCSVVIMPTYKPEGMGNCLTALWMGARLYMYKRNLQYQYFKRLGLIVYSIEDDLKRTNKDWNVPLNSTQIIHNRQILMANYGDAVIKQKIELIISELDK